MNLPDPCMAAVEPGQLPAREGAFARAVRKFLRWKKSLRAKRAARRARTP
jgi:hypothetical protein